MKKIFLASFTLFFVVGVHAQLVFQKYYGGASNDEAVGVIAESDHSFFIIANTISYGQGGGEEDAMHIKVDAAGNIVSSTTYGTSPLRERVRAVQKTSDGGYLAIGDKKYSGASDDVYVQKLNSAATQTSLYFYGDNNTGDEEIFAAQEVTAVGYYIMFGFDNYHGSPGGQDAFFKIINAGTGTHVASRYYGGLGWADAAFDGFWSNANGIFFAGRTNSIGAGGFDGLVVRTSNISPYNITWQRAIGGAGDDEFLSMKEVSGSGVICAGYTTNFGAVGEDIFVTRIDLNGNLLWSRRIGGAGNERARCILPTADGGFIIAGHTNSAGAGGEDAFLIKLASDGSTQWARLYGGPANDGFLSLAIRPTSFGYAAVGYTNSFTSGGSDMYFVAVDNTGASSCNQSNWNPTNVTVTPTVTTSGLAVVTTGHNSFAQALLTTTPVLATNCNCIEERPRVDIAGPTQVCRNQTNVSFSIPAITGVTTYNWTATNATITSPLNSTSVNINFGTNNSQIIVQAIYGNCSTFNIDTINVTIDPVTANIPAVAPICIGQSVTLNANAIAPVSGVSGYLWNTGASTSSINVTPAVGNTVYTVTITDGLGCTATATQTVVVNPLPIPTASSNSPVCAGNTINLTSGGGVSYSWIGPNAFSNNTQNPSIASATSSHAGTYTVTVTDANTCTASITTNVVVNPLPIPTASSNSPVCAGNTINLTSGGGVSYSWIGPNAFSNNTQNPSIASATSSHAGTYTVTVTDANTCTASITTNVVINPLPIPTASSNSPVCVGNTINLTSGGGVSYSWTGPNAFSNNTQNPSIASATSSHAGTYTVTVTDANTCTASITTNVVVNPLPIPTASSNSPVCAGNTINLTSGGGVSYSWIGPNAFSNNTQNPSIASATSSHAGTYTVTVTDANTCTASITTNVVINPLPIPTASSNSPVCAGNTINLMSGGGVSYSWIGPNAFSNNTQNPSIASATSSHAGTYTVTVTDANTCTASITTNVVVNPLPIPTASSNSPVCVGNTINLTSGGGVSYSWIGPNAFSNNTQNPSIASATSSHAGTYTVTVTDANTCTASITTNVVVNPLPIPTASSNSPVCVGEAINLTSGGGVSYSWTGPNAFSNNTQNPSIASATSSHAGTYTVTVTDANTCTASITTNVVVNPLPTPIASNNGPLCINNTLELYVTAAVSYNWSGPNAFTSTSQNPVLPLVTLAENGTYTVTVTDINGCTATSTTAVTVSPSLSFSATSNSPLCVGETLSFTSSPGSSHVWIGPNAFSSSTENPVINGVTLSAAGVYTVTVTNLQGCTGSSSINVVINPLPVVNLGNDTLVCGSISLQLDAGNSGSSYVWNDGSSSQTLSVNAPGIYMVTVTDANGCSANDQLVITTETLPIVDLGPDQVICEGSTVILDASNTNATYLWSTGATTASITVSAEATYTVTVYKCNTSVTDQVLITVDEIELLTQNQVNPDCGMNNGEITLSVNGGMGMLSYAWQQLPAQTGSAATGLVEGSYNVVVTDAQGCTDAITVTLICISPEIIIPQFISPNGDGKNDVLIIQNLMPSYTNNIFKIFNRWGNEVYVSSPYQNNWDGRSNTGLSIGSSILPAGTYFYVLDLQGDGSDVRTGFVELQP